MLLFLFLITDIFLIVSYKKYKKRRDSKSYNTLFGCFIACVIVCAISFYLIDNFTDMIVTEEGRNGVLNLLFKYLLVIIHFVVNFSLFIVYHFNKSINIKIKKSFILPCLIIILISSFGIWRELINPINAYNDEMNERKKYTISYLEDRYGDGNFKITNVYKAYSHASFAFDFEYLEAYIFEVKSDLLDKNFYVIIDNSKYCIRNDTFLFSYYSEKNNLNYSIKFRTGDYPLEKYDELEEYINKLMSNSGYSEDYKFNIDSYFYDVYHSECINKNGKREIPSLDDFVKNYVEMKNKQG